MSAKQVFISVILSFFLLLQSCVKEDFTKISDEFDWQPNISIPVATDTMNSDNYRGSLSFLDHYNLANEILISKTIDFDFADIFSEENHVEKLMFRFDIENRFPARLEVYPYCLNENLQIVPSIFTDSPLQIPAPQIDDEGSVIRGSQLIFDEYVSEEDIPSISGVKHILIQIYIKELDQNPEVISKIADYEIEIGVGIRAYLNIPINE